MRYQHVMDGRLMRVVPAKPLELLTEAERQEIALGEHRQLVAMAMSRSIDKHLRLTTPVDRRA